MNSVRTVEVWLLERQRPGDPGFTGESSIANGVEFGWYIERPACIALYDEETRALSFLPGTHLAEFRRVVRIPISIENVVSLASAYLTQETAKIAAEEISRWIRDQLLPHVEFMHAE